MNSVLTTKGHSFMSPKFIDVQVSLNLCTPAGFVRESLHRHQEAATKYRHLHIRSWLHFHRCGTEGQPFCLLQAVVLECLCPPLVHRTGKLLLHTERKAQRASAGSCDSTITYIDGKKGVLLYRGYDWALGQCA